MSNTCAKKVTRNKTLKTIFTLECIIPLWLNVNPSACTEHETNTAAQQREPPVPTLLDKPRKLNVLLMAAFNL